MYGGRGGRVVYFVLYVGVITHRSVDICMCVVNMYKSCHGACGSIVIKALRY
jgi:hypothetical protein